MLTRGFRTDPLNHFPLYPGTPLSVLPYWTSLTDSGARSCKPLYRQPPLSRYYRSLRYAGTSSTARGETQVRPSSRNLSSWNFRPYNPGFPVPSIFLSAFSAELSLSLFLFSLFHHLFRLWRWSAPDRQCHHSPLAHLQVTTVGSTPTSRLPGLLPTTG